MLGYIVDAKNLVWAIVVLTRGRKRLWRWW